MCPSVHSLFSRSQYRAVTASLNLAEAPRAVSLDTGLVATFPTTHNVVSFISIPSSARRRGRADTRTGRSRTAASGADTASAVSVAVAAGSDCLRRAGPAAPCAQPVACGQLRHPDGSSGRGDRDR
ncbi:hypothetical protein GCM10010145_26370 [Streptomyces ruber]|uniref:Uncharacterized protein n=2 Tax=Streptomyces TaxID=1883 RepID=A0A918BDC8_9ACTN|nr:hypothetical protein GCM10010145_26370 [Streptomyces ruber]